MGPPLHMPRNLLVESLKLQTQKEIIKQKGILKALSKKAYENNIPEDNFDGSHIKGLLGEEPSIVADIITLDSSLTVKSIFL